MTFAAVFSGEGTAFEAPRSLYVHVPFCASRCAYCDFHSYPRDRHSLELRAAYVAKLLARVEKVGAGMTESFETIYIGGGTPTTLDDEIFDSLIRGLRSITGNSVREWTVEANPESLSPFKLKTMVDNGVTRVSIGIQSMDDGELKILGRGARSADNRRAVALAIDSGLAVSADLITALPRAAKGEASLHDSASSPSLSETVEYLAGSGVEHISIYDLVVEEGTLIKTRLDEGAILPADDDAAFDERSAAEKSLESLGYGRYEVSNYAKPGRECLHNMAYWSMNSYLGIGSGAVSTLIVDSAAHAAKADGAERRALRVEEGKNLAGWLENPDDAAKFDWIEAKDSAFEMIMMGLRCSIGLDENRFKSRFGLAAHDLLAGTMLKWSERFSRSEGHIRLDGRGLDLLNRILVDALVEMDKRYSLSDRVNQ